MIDFEAIKAFQGHCKEQALECADLVYTLQSHDKTMMKETLKSLYHLNWSFADLAEALEEITGESGKIEYKPGLLAISRQEPKHKDLTEAEISLRKMHSTAALAYSDLHGFLQDIEKSGIKLKLLPHFMARLRADTLFLEMDLHHLGIMT